VGYRRNDKTTTGYYSSLWHGQKAIDYSIEVARLDRILKAKPPILAGWQDNFLCAEVFRKLDKEKTREIPSWCFIANCQ
jgi:hypothetical protein